MAECLKRKGNPYRHDLFPTVYFLSRTSLVIVYPYAHTSNAAAESFFGLLKWEWVNRQHYRTRAEARADIFDYIERGHNSRQRRRLEMQQRQEELLT